MNGLFKDGCVIGWIEEWGGQIINILDADDNSRLRLIDPVMPDQTQLVLQNKTKHAKIKRKTKTQNFYGNKKVQNYLASTKRN